LVIPDIVFGSEALIASKLGTEGAAAIKFFLESGGTIITAGKSGAVLEKLSDYLPADQRFMVPSTYKADALITPKGSL